MSQSPQMKSGYRSIWKIAWPIILGSFAQNAIAIIDTAFMGRVGEAELGAIGYVALFYLILFMVGFGYTKGTQIMVARRLGEQKFDEVGKVMDNSIYLIMTIATAVFLVLFLFGHELLGLLINSPEILRKSDEYLELRIYGVFGGYLWAVVSAFFMGIGTTGVIFVSMGVMGAVNIFLNYVLVFGKLGFPEMGIAGAALGSVAAEYISVAIIVAYIFIGGFHKRYNFFRPILPDWSILKRLSDLSLPIVGQYLIGLGAWFMFFTLIEKMGEMELAVSNIVKSIYMFFGIPTWGFASAANTLVSNVMGQGKNDEVIPVLKRIIYLSLACSFALILVMIIFPKALMKVYTADIEIIQAGIPIIYVCTISMFMFAFSNVLFSGIVSTGSTMRALRIEAISVALYVIYIFMVIIYLDLGLTVAWTSEFVYWIMIAVQTYLFLRSGNWQKAKV